jgi:transaldolase
MADQMVTLGGDGDLSQLVAEGVSPWLDGVYYELIASGQLTHLIRHLGVRGVTSNVEVLADAVEEGGHYRDRLAGLASRSWSVDAAIRSLSTYDVRRACTELHQIFETTYGFDGHVSMDLDPALADDASAVVKQAIEISQLVNRPNLLAKIRVSAEGIIAIRKCLGQGIGVQAADVVSVGRYGEVLDAVFDGLELATAAGLRPPAAVTSVPVGRIDAEIDARLDDLGTEPARALRGKAAVATARLVHQLYEQRLGSERWRGLTAAGAQPPRLMWTETSVSDPAYPPMLYVDEFVAWGTINAMSLPTLEAAAHSSTLHGDTLTSEHEAATAVLNEIERLGVSLVDVAQALENSCARRQIDSWQELAARVEHQLRAAGGTSP